MSSIIPYEKRLFENRGAFISPEGEIIFTNGNHERFASNYCNGEDFKLLSEVKNGFSYYSDHFDEFKKHYNFDGEITDIDVYSSTKLTSEQLKLYRLWLEKYEFAKRNLFSDFLVHLLSFDKVETILRKAITTTATQPHVRFFNYYLMEWRIDDQWPMRYNKDTGLFEYYQPPTWSYANARDREFEEEIKEIKSRVLLKDRHLFFK